MPRDNYITSKERAESAQLAVNLNVTPAHTKRAVKLLNKYAKHLLSPAERAIYLKWARVAVASGTLNDATFLAFINLVRKQAIVDRLQEAVNKDQAPADAKYRLLLSAQNDVAKLFTNFGMTPTTQYKVSDGSKAAIDEFSDF